MAALDQIFEQVKERITNEKYFVARNLQLLSQSTGVERDILVKGIAGVVTVYLIFGEKANLVANAILTGYPILVQFVYTDECPEENDLIAYWIIFVLVTLFDSPFQDSIPGYFVLKIGLLALLFLEPFRFIKPLSNLIKEQRESQGYRNQAQNQSPKPAEKTDKSMCPDITQMSVTDASTNIKELNSDAERINASFNKHANLPLSCLLDPTKTEDLKAKEPLFTPEPEPPKDPEPAPAPAPEPTTPPQLTTPIPPQSEDNQTCRTAQGSGGPRSEYATTPNQINTAQSSGSLVDNRDHARFRGENPMLNDSQYRISTSASGTPNKDIGPASNLNDMVFFPMDRLVFNGPFDVDNLTYHMRIENRSRHRIAFAVKGNAVPRVTAYPPSGILEVGAKKIIAVTCAKFAYNESQFNKDRIVFEYVLLKNEHADVKEFAHSLLQHSNFKMRKNIKIAYNP